MDLGKISTDGMEQSNDCSGLQNRIHTDLKSESNNFQNCFNAKHCRKAQINVQHHFFICFTLAVEL